MISNSKPFGKPRLGEQFLRLGEILLEADLPRDLFGRAADADRQIVRRAQRRAAEHRLDDAVIVDRIADRLPRFLHGERLVELRLLGQRHVDEVEARERGEAHVRLGLERGDLLRDQVERRIDVAAAHRQQLRGAVPDVTDHDALERRLAAPVMLVAHELDLLVALPGGDPVGAGAAGVAVEPRPRPCPSSWRPCRRCRRSPPPPCARARRIPAPR